MIEYKHNSSAADIRPMSSRAVTEEAIACWVWPALCCCAALAAILISNPFNDVGFDDDWSYSAVARRFAQTGQFRYNGWGSPLILFQVLWAAPWIRLFGASSQVLQASIIPISIAAVLLTYATGRRLNLARDRAAFAALRLPLRLFFVFDNQILAQAVMLKSRIGEISCPTRYFADASSINFRRSTIYGLGVLKTAMNFRMARLGLYRDPIFEFRSEVIERSAGGVLIPRHTAVNQAVATQP